MNLYQRVKDFFLNTLFEAKMECLHIEMCLACRFYMFTKPLFSKIEMQFLHQVKLNFGYPSKL